MKSFTHSLLKNCLLVLVFAGFTVQAQQQNTLYFLRNVPSRNFLNPAFQPECDYFFRFPVISYTQFGIGNNSLTLKDVVYKVDGTPITFLNAKGDKNKFYNSLKSNLLLQTDVRTELFGFGFRHGNDYWTFDIDERLEGAVVIPKGLVKLLLFGTPDQDKNNIYNVSSLGGDVSMYTEAALGYSKKLNDKVSFGVKAKFLYGSFNIKSTNSTMNIDAALDNWNLKGVNTINYSGPWAVTGNSLSTFVVNSNSSSSAYLKPSGLGAGIDLGVSYVPVEKLTVSAALLDLGFIRWSKNAMTVTNNVNFDYSGVNDLDNKLESQKIRDSVINVFKSSTKTDVKRSSYTSYTTAKLNIGAEYALFNDKMSVGLLSRTLRRNNATFEEITTSVNGRPCDWFNMSLSYSVLNGKGNNIGAGIGLKTGPLNWFLAADYVPFNYAKIHINNSGNEVSFPVGYKTTTMNFSFGLTFALGPQTDEDHDGVKDKFDKCPHTPRGVRVDKNGCPLDGDKDGVPDYKDKCPETKPQAVAFVDTLGCDKDTDGDSVPDYKDKCPGTPKEAYSSIDSVGCPKDTDKDGVADYKDKCPQTPAGVRVDSVGCPLDADLDGIPDYKDKCPQTSTGVPVDSLGCPLDSDKDGIPDYKDKCPKTPVLANVKLDENGCPVDSDGDGIPDYLDKCPDTPAEAKGKLDENGCPLDSDNDGIPDYKDKCPDTALADKAYVDADGCAKSDIHSKLVAKKQEALNVKNLPDRKQFQLKPEYQDLFKKALQGIKFKTGKYSILPVSFRILNQVAGVLITNPYFLVEIGGHTDNRGNHAANKLLSQNRANAVKKYLQKKGINPGRMTAVGYGDTVPVSNNNTEKGRNLNRRVEFIVSYQEITFGN